MLNRADEFLAELLELKQKREALAAQQLQYKEMREAFLAEAQPLIDAVDAGKAAVKEQEDCVRALGLDWYAADDSTKSLPHGVKVAITKQVEFSKADALDWATEKGIALKLDETAFKQLAKSGAANGIPAEVVEVPTIKLPTKIKIESQPVTQ